MFYLFSCMAFMYDTPQAWLFNNLDFDINTFMYNY